MALRQQPTMASSSPFSYSESYSESFHDYGERHGWEDGSLSGDDWGMLSPPAMSAQQQHQSAAIPNFAAVGYGNHRHHHHQIYSERSGRDRAGAGCTTHNWAPQMFGCDAFVQQQQQQPFVHHIPEAHDNRVSVELSETGTRHPGDFGGFNRTGDGITEEGGVTAGGTWQTPGSLSTRRQRSGSSRTPPGYGFVRPPVHPAAVRPGFRESAGGATPEAATPQPPPPPPPSSSSSPATQGYDSHDCVELGLSMSGSGVGYPDSLGRQNRPPSSSASTVSSSFRDGKESGGSTGGSAHGGTTPDLSSTSGETMVHGYAQSRWSKRAAIAAARKHKNAAAKIGATIGGERVICGRRVVGAFSGTAPAVAPAMRNTQQAIRRTPDTGPLTAFSLMGAAPSKEEAATTKITTPTGGSGDNDNSSDPRKPAAANSDAHGGGGGQTFGRDIPHSASGDSDAGSNNGVGDESIEYETEKGQAEASGAGPTMRGETAEDDEDHTHQARKEDGLWAGGLGLDTSEEAARLGSVENQQQVTEGCRSVGGCTVGWSALCCTGGVGLYGIQRSATEFTSNSS